MVIDYCISADTGCVLVVGPDRSSGKREGHSWNLWTVGKTWKTGVPVVVDDTRRRGAAGSWSPMDVYIYIFFLDYPIIYIYIYRSLGGQGPCSTFSALIVNNWRLLHSSSSPRSTTFTTPLTLGNWSIGSSKKYIIYHRRYRICTSWRTR